MVNRHAEIFKDCDNLKTITTTSGKTIMNESYRSKYITALKRQRESYRRKRLKESSTECSGTHFRVSYDSNGTPSAVMVKADTEQAAKDTYMKLKGAKYPKVYGVTKMSDYEVRDYKKRGMSCLN